MRSVAPVVPAVFTYIDDFGQWVARLWHRKQV